MATSAALEKIVGHCTTGCKFSGKETDGKKQLPMIRCCSCMRWFHNECMDVEENETSIWNCDKCRMAPYLIAQLLEQVNKLSESQLKMEKMLSSLSDECRMLKVENERLRSQPQPQPKKTSLVIGDSLLRDIDQNKLQDTRVISLSGGTLQDARRTLDQNSNVFDHIFLAIGTNDCSRESFSEGTFIEAYKDLVQAAKQKVSDESKVCIVTIPPRMDSMSHQSNIELVNGCLASLADETNAKIINNDSTFKLADGSPNDAYLLSDQLHLSCNGTKRLVKNMGLSVKEEWKDDPTKKKQYVRHQIKKREAEKSSTESLPRHRKRRVQPQPNVQNRSHAQPNSSIHQQRNELQGPRSGPTTSAARHHPRECNRSVDTTVQYSHRGCNIDKWRRQNSRDFEGNSTCRNQQRVSPMSACHFCGEQNHGTNHCRYGRPLVCYSCKTQGHKARSCRHYSHSD
jgi:lysophospholipase L1-like esterase